jgi:glyoxylase-like metal-dependent hydrolase (beta-lactamase superfamily II)
VNLPANTATTGVRFLHEAAPGPGEVIEIAEGVLWARLPLPMKLDHVNVYILDDGDGWTVVDTGFRGENSKAIWAKLLAGPLAGKPVRRVIATHHHPDHIGLAGWFIRDHGAELWTTRTAWLFARMLQLDHNDTPAEENIAHYRRAGAPEAALERYRTAKPFNFSQTVEPLPLGFRRVKEGDEIRIGGRDWRVLCGNGHAPEHATFWSKDDNLVLSGDQVIPGISSNLGVYATEPDADPVGDWLESCERLKLEAREDHLALPGHKLPFTGVPTRLDQLIDNHHGALKRLRLHLAEPRSAVDCFAPIFRREIGESEFGLAMIEAIAHVNHLHQTGEATRETDAAGVDRFRIRAK